MNYYISYKDYFTKIVFITTLLIYLIAITHYSYSQTTPTINFENYQPLQSKGTVPQDFLLSVSKRYLAKNETIAEGTNKKTAKSIDNFNLQSSFSLKQLLWSGNVIFGDEVSQYLK